MPVWLKTSDSGFAPAFDAFLATKREASADVDLAVRNILADVKARGDAALIDLSQKFDSVDLGKRGIRVTADEVEVAIKACSAETLDEIGRAHV